MRNPARLSNDGTDTARPLMRKRPGYRLVRGFGRGIVVRRNMSKTTRIGYAAGVLMVIGGLICITWASVEERNFSPEAVGRVALILGVIAVFHFRLMERASAADEMMRFQYDIGYEAGWQERDKTARPPKVVDLTSRQCPSCKAAQQSVLARN